MRRTLLLLALVACGGDDKKTPDAAPPPIDAPPPVPLTCTQYCTQVMANCTGANAQYADLRHCMGSCATFPPGGTVTDTTGNTLGCRIYHSGAPAKMDATLHCPHAGPVGDLIAAGTAPTYCGGGDLCATFCAEEIKTCGSTDVPITLNGTPIVAQYKNQAACEAVCKNGDNTVTPPIPKFDAAHVYATNSAGNSLACRFNHWTNAASLSIVDPADATKLVNPAGVNTHCGHATAVPAANTPCVAAIPTP